MAQDQSNMNVVFICCDDAVAYWKYKSAFGVELHTPNLDRICNQSTAFHAAYSQGVFCAPSRASLMTGLSPHQTGVVSDHPSIFDVVAPQKIWVHSLRQAGFFCSSGGKVAKNYGALHEPFHSTLFSDEPKWFPLPRRGRAGIDDGIERISFGGFRNGDAMDEQHLYDYHSVNSVKKFLSSYEGAAPFYREVGLISTHGPWMTPRSFKELYDPKDFQQPKEWSNGFEENAFITESAPPNLHDTSLDFWQKSVRNYFSSLSYIDQQIGKVWDSIKQSDFADNTIVVITSDHGLHLGERSLFRKHTLWEQVANVPLIIHDPRHPTQQVVTDPVGLIDVGPTIMDYLELDPIPESPGRSLRPLIDWGSAPERVVPTFHDQSVGIRFDRYRFIQYQDGSTQLFDLAKDWWQTTNLGDDHPIYKTAQAIMAECCAEYSYSQGANPG